MLPKNAVQLTPCANPLSSSWPNCATSAFSQPSPVNYTFLTFFHQHSSNKGENTQQVRLSSCCHLDLIVLIDLQEKVKPNSDGSSPFALKGFGYQVPLTHVKPWTIPASLEDSPCCLKYFLGIHSKQFQATTNDASVVTIIHRNGAAVFQPKALPVRNIFRAQSEELISLLFVQAPNLSHGDFFG